ncbi:hypothetical protein ACO0LF_27085 [Undibacterium sp. Di27W]|uniref:hypothetical protein n=1 Tax=Undibacterium sp. Di27W TaxID=3413036 RepID=UPI003BEFD95E
MVRYNAPYALLCVCGAIFGFDVPCDLGIGVTSAVQLAYMDAPSVVIPAQAGIHRIYGLSFAAP